MRSNSIWAYLSVCPQGEISYIIFTVGWSTSPHRRRRSVLTGPSLAAVNLHWRLTKVLWVGESDGHSVMSGSLWPHGLWPARLLWPWKSPAKNTKVGSLSLLHGVSLIKALNPGRPHCRQILYHLSHLWVGSVLVSQSSLTLCDPVNCGPPISSVHRILQTRILE